MYEFCRGGALLPGWLVGCHDNNPSQLVNHPRARPIHPLGFTDPTTDTDTTHCRFLSRFNSHPSSYPSRFIPVSAIHGYMERATRRPNDHPYFLLCFDIHRIQGVHIISGLVLNGYREKFEGLGKNPWLFLLDIDLLIGLVFLLIDLSQGKIANSLDWKYLLYQ